jgi:hypothetical protein
MSKIEEYRKSLAVVAERMYRHTEPECRLTCKNPHSCCTPEYCQIAEEMALKFFDTKLEPTGHETLKFMGKHGCIVPPEMRLICTVHTCEINAWGLKAGDAEWTRKYFALRKKIDDVFGRLSLAVHDAKM